MQTFAGTGTAGYSGNNGPASSAQIYGPRGMVMDATGANLYFSDFGNHCIRVISMSTGNIAVYAGTPQSAGFSGDGGPATSAQINGPNDVIRDNSGNLVVSDYGNHCVRQISFSTGIITTKAGFCGISGFNNKLNS